MIDSAILRRNLARDVQFNDYKILARYLLHNLSEKVLYHVRREHTIFPNTQSGKETRPVR